MNNITDNNQSYNQEQRGDITGSQQAYDQSQRAGFQPSSTEQNISVGQDQRGFQPQNVGNIQDQAFGTHKSSHMDPAQFMPGQEHIQQQGYEQHKHNLDSSIPRGATDSQQTYGQTGGNFEQTTGGYAQQQPSHQHRSDLTSSLPTSGNAQQQAYDQHKSNLDTGATTGSNVQQHAYDQHKSNLDTGAAAGGIAGGDIQKKAYDEHKSNLDSNTSTGGNVQQHAYDQHKSNLDSGVAAGGVAGGDIQKKAYDEHKSNLDSNTSTGGNVQQHAYDQHKSNLDSGVAAGGVAGGDIQKKAYDEHKSNLDSNTPTGGNVQKQAYDEHKSNLDNKDTTHNNKSDKVVTDPKAVKSTAREEKIGGVIDKLVAKVENVLGLKDKAEIRQATGVAKTEHAKQVQETGEFKPSEVPKKADIANAYNNGEDVSNISNSNKASDNEAYDAQKQKFTTEHVGDKSRDNAGVHPTDSDPVKANVQKQAYDEHKASIDKQQTSDHLQSNAAAGGQNTRDADRKSADVALGSGKREGDFIETGNKPASAGNITSTTHQAAPEHVASSTAHTAPGNITSTSDHNAGQHQIPSTNEAPSKVGQLGQMPGAF
ncbi:hypothetical protein BC943DRAFT_353461 [Umbelopsis sp. AD052]|nr:hypothetical protein BC943DRAFT_353461 [Umbelopsis sp. AD052]